MDVYFKKEISYLFEGKEFKFDVAEILFSTFAIDHGTDILIRAIPPSKSKTILDLGCGYGPLGIILAKNNPQAEVIMVDKDLLAVRYTKHNIARNNITNAVVIGSLGIESIKEKTFDLIVSNIPAKIGDEAIAAVSALNRLIPQVCSMNNIKIKEIRKRRGHTIFRLKKPVGEN